MKEHLTVKTISQTNVQSKLANQARKKRLLASIISIILIVSAISLPFIFQLHLNSKTDANGKRPTTTEGPDNIQKTTSAATDDSWSCGNMSILVGYSPTGLLTTNFSPMTYRQCCDWCLGTPNCLALAWSRSNTSSKAEKLRCYLFNDYVFFEHQITKITAFLHYPD